MDAPSSTRLAYGPPLPEGEGWGEGVCEWARARSPAATPPRRACPRPPLPSPRSRPRRGVGAEEELDPVEAGWPRALRLGRDVDRELGAAHAELLHLRRHLAAEALAGRAARGRELRAELRHLAPALVELAPQRRLVAGRSLDRGELALELIEPAREVVGGRGVLDRGPPD